MKETLLFLLVLIIEVSMAPAAEPKAIRCNQIRQAMIATGQNTPDAFDFDRIAEIGLYRYMCEEGQYSRQLDLLCAEFKRYCCGKHVACH